MATPVEAPKLGNTVEECVIAKWRKAKGERVAAGDILTDIETDKATFEVAAPVDGVLLETFFTEGSLVPVFTVICVIGEPGENVEAFRPAQQPSAPAQPATPERAARSRGCAHRRGAGGRPTALRRRGSLQPARAAVRRRARFSPRGSRGLGPGRARARGGSAQAVPLRAARLPGRPAAHGGRLRIARGRFRSGRHDPGRRPRSAGRAHVRHPRENRAPHEGIAGRHRSIHAQRVRRSHGAAGVAHAGESLGWGRRQHRGYDRLLRHPGAARVPRSERRADRRQALQTLRDQSGLRLRHAAGGSWFRWCGTRTK